MELDPAEIAGLLPFEQRYERRRQRWLDGPHGSWEAFDRVLEREVILNVAWRHSDVPAFLRSARLAASFRHPNLLPIYDLGILDGTTPFYTTPRIPGGTLRSLLRRVYWDVPPSGPGFAIPSLVGAVRDACRALEYAHRRGLLHLDLHPDDLLVGEDDLIVLDVHDWKSRRLREGGVAEPSPVSGFPAYLSPEQIADQSSLVGPATDVFGLGGILHLILFDTPPNCLSRGASAVEVIKAIRDRRSAPRRPGTLSPTIRSSEGRRKIDRLVAICLKALAYEPERRYPTAAALGAALDEWLEAQRSPWWGPFRRRVTGDQFRDRPRSET